MSGALLTLAAVPPLRALAVACLALGCAEPPVSPPRLAVRVDVGSEPTGPPISPRLFGANAIWIDGGQGLVRRGTGEPDPATIEAVKALGVALIRFPGGTLSHAYRFMDGIGPMAGRKPGHDVFQNRAVESDYGFDEFMRCAALAGAEPIVCLNWKTGSPAESAAFVAYANARPEDATPLGMDAGGRDFGTAGDWARRRAENGRAEPYGVKLIEVGNETNLRRFGETVADYARGYRAHAEAVRRVDPSARLFAPGNLEMGTPGMKEEKTPGALPWNDTLLREAGALLDGLALHYYATERGAEGGAAKLLLEPARLEAAVMELRERAAAFRPAGAPPLGIAITEYGTFFRAEGDAGFTAENASPRTALFQASVLLAAARLGIDAACLHALLLEKPANDDLAGGVYFGMLRRERPGAPIERAPIALVFPEARRALAGAVPVGVRLSGDRLAAGVEPVDAFASRDPATGETRVVLVARAAVDSVALDVGGEGVGSATLTLVAADSLDAREARREERPLEVGADGRVRIVLPPAAFAVVRLRAR